MSRPFHWIRNSAGLRIDETIDPDPTTSSDEFTRTAEYEYDQLYRLTNETVTDVLAGVTTAFEQSYTFDLVGNRLRKIIAAVGGSGLPSGWTAGTTTSTYNARDQLLSTAAGAATTKFGYDANGSLTTRKSGSDALLFRQGYDLKNRLVEADADGDADADLRLAYDRQEGRVARHTLDGTGAVTGSEHYLLDRMNPIPTHRL